MNNNDNINNNTFCEDWSVALGQWAEQRYNTAEAFYVKGFNDMMENEWMNASGRWDVEGIKLGLSKMLGQRETMA